MGGRLLTQVFGLPEKRISRVDYFSIRQQLCVDFRDIYPDCRIATPEVFFEKEDFGDIDVLCNLQGEQILKVIREKYKVKPHCNAGVYSFPLDGFQCDIISVCDKYFQITHDFYSWGDLGNILGRQFNAIGLNFGHKGLVYKLHHSYFSGKQEDVSPIDKILICTDMQEILEYIGLDYSRWLDGFRNEREAFEFAELGKYFNPRMFFFEELNHINRTRNRKRPMYCRFVERIQEKYKDKIIPRIGSGYYWPYVVQRWPHILTEIEKHRENYERNYIISKKFNGDLVKELTGLEGPDLGKFIARFKNSFEDFKNWVFTSSTESINLEIIGFKNKLVY